MSKKMSLASLLVICLIAALAACAPAPEAKDEAAAPAEGKLYGAEFTLTEATPIADLLANPDEYVGKTVLIKAAATHVCKHSGKRLQLTDAASESRIMVDFSGAGLELPAEILNHVVIAEGVFTRRDLGVAPKDEDHDHEKAHAEGTPHEHAEKADSGDCAAEKADANPENHVYVIEGVGVRDLDVTA